MKTSLLSLLAISTLGLGACIDASDDSVDTTEPGSSARIAMNSLGPGAFVMALPTNTLSTSSSATQVSTLNGRTTMSYIISCALSSTQTFSVPAPGLGFYQWQGDIGIAPTWLTQPLNAAQAAAVSACVVSRLNADSIAVSISLRSAYLTATTTEQNNYFLDEATFFGNIFPNLGPTTNYACPGADKVATPTAGDLANRKCAVDQGDGTSRCNLIIPGNCADICTWDSLGKYRTCTVNGTTFPYAITTFVQ